MLRLLLLPVLALAGVLALTARLGASRWEKATRDLLARLDAGRSPVEPTRFDPSELDGLPAPVGRCLRAVLREGQPLVTAVEIDHAGTFDMGRVRPSWKPYTSRQRAVTRRPGFVWSARMPMAPGLPVRVHDAYVAGEAQQEAQHFREVHVQRAYDVDEVRALVAETPFVVEALYDNFSTDPATAANLKPAAGIRPPHRERLFDERP